MMKGTGIVVGIKVGVSLFLVDISGFYGVL